MKSTEIHRAARFLATGGINTAVYYLQYAALVWLGISTGLAVTAATLLTIPISFVNFALRVYGARPTPSGLRRFAALYAALYLLNLGAATAFVEIGIGEYLAGLLAAMLTASASYTGNGLYVFRKGERDEYE